MAQKVLTNRIKSQIIDNALVKAGIPERKAALRAARVAWAERARLAFARLNVCWKNGPKRKNCYPPTRPPSRFHPQYDAKRSTK